MKHTDEPELTSHEYDGIQEYDNPLPNWWLMTFIGTVIFAFLYWVHYELGGGGPSLKDELAAAMHVIEGQKAVAAGKSLTDEEIIAKIEGGGLVNDALVASFNGKCAACHGTSLEGLIGPNLTDEYWLQGQGTAPDIVKVIKEGVPAKGMPPWGPILSEDEIIGMTAYILAKQDSKPANAKAPQGEKVR